mgnify:FL=1|tara:strand:+ start:31 stop:489 length:459 start_codon:yes stop_codon:yes gene_type:complete
MNTSLIIVTEDKLIGIGTTILSGIGTDMSWIPSDVHAVHWNGTSGEIEYNDGKPNLSISSIGIYSQAETTFNNEIKRRKDLDDEYLNSSSFLWMKLRSERDNLLLSSDFTQLGDIGLSETKKTEWVNYRQSLRDLPANTSDPANPIWPTRPS